MKRQFLWILLTLFLAASWFYWFQWKPAKTREFCVDAAMNQAKAISVEKLRMRDKINSITYTKEEMALSQRLTQQFIDQGYHENDVYDREYLNCLRSNGLKN